MSNTKGAMLISNANAVGTELVNQLGGTGYKPVEWSDKINLLGINSADAPYAIKSIQAGTYTGDERGAIQYSNCNAVGSMLNKKLDTNRGFKPVEWPNSIKLLNLLTEETVTGAICNVPDGADDVPVKSWNVNIPANLSGKSTVVCTDTGTSIFLPQDIVQGSISGSGYNTDSNYRVRTADRTAVTPSTEYKIKVNSEVQIYEVHEYTDLTGSSTHLTVNASEYTFTTKSTTNYLRILFRYSNNATIIPSAITQLQVTDGALYWKTNTIDLGRTVYGADVDVVTGEAKPINICNAYGTNTDNGYILYYYLLNTGETYYNSAWSTSEYIEVKENTQYTLSGIIGGNPSICFYDENKSFLSGIKYGNASPKTVTSPSGAVFARLSVENSLKDVWQMEEGTTATAYSPYFTPFTFDPITPTPETNTSVNFWSDSNGDSSVTYRQAPTALTRSTVSGSVASFSDADTRYTCVNAKANIAPSIAGTDTVQLVDGGKNFLDESTIQNGYQINSTSGLPTAWTGRCATTSPITIHGGNITVSYTSTDSLVRLMYSFFKGDTFIERVANIASGTTINAHDYDTMYIGFANVNGTAITKDVLSNIMVEYGSTATAYTPYVAPTTYTATLPSTNYGGSVDFVSGDVVESSILIDLSELTGWNLDGTTRFRVRMTDYQSSSGWSGSWENTKSNAFVCENPATSFSNRSDYSFANIPQNYYNFDVKVPSGDFSTTDDFEAWLANIDGNGTHAVIVFDRNGNITSNITGQAIIPKTGTNNCYNNIGGNTEITYFTT